MIKIKQFMEKETCTYTYIIYEERSKDAVIIDSVYGFTELYMDYIENNDLKLKYILETHIHADHTTNAKKIKERTNAKIGLSYNAKTPCQDLYLKNNDILKIGTAEITVMETFGHTNTCVSFIIDKNIFTGDALLINGSGRTDFQAGNPEILYESIMKMYSLNEDIIVYPAHDYKGYKKSTIKEQKESNRRININTKIEDFVEIMNNLNLPYPKYIKKAVPENMNCGEKNNQITK